MLLGRAAECAAIDELLAGARREQSAARTISGEPGVGKSALLRYAVGRADGMRVLTVRGIESEVKTPFVALYDLFRPVLAHLDALPAAQAAALAGALALEPAAPREGLAVSAATLGLLAAAAEESPLLAIVDDAHWLDASSARVLGFAARRLQAEGIVMLFAQRDLEPSPIDVHGIETLTLVGLDRDSARVLVELHADRSVTDVAFERMFEATRGNPLALIELAQSAESVRWSDPSPVPPTVREGFHRLVDGMSADAQGALLLAAANDTLDAAAVVAALRRVSGGASGLAEAEAAGLVAVAGGRLEFRHPLLRSTVYHSADPASRRQAHARLAAELEGDPARCTWHLAAAAVEPDEQVAGSLAAVAADARGRGAHETAARAFERAAQLTPDDEPQAQRLSEAAAESWVAGNSEDALRLLDEALRCPVDNALLSEVRRRRALIVMWSADPIAASVALEAEAELTAAADPGRAVHLYIEASVAAQQAARLGRSVELARRAEELSSRSGVERVAAAGELAKALLIVGKAQGAADYVEQAHAEARDSAVFDLPLVLNRAGAMLYWLERFADAQRVFEGVIADARANGALAVLAYPLSALSELEFRIADWQAAYAHAAEAVRVGRETGQRGPLAHSLIALARVEAGLGRDAAMNEHLAEALVIVDALGAHSLRFYAEDVLGFAALGRRRIDDAIAHLEALAHLVDEHGMHDPEVILWRSNLVTAYAAAGRMDDAARALEGFGEGERAGRAWPAAAVARGAGLLAAEDEFEAAFVDALRWHGETTMPFEEALTCLLFGRRLRRSKRLGDARVQLHAALATFDRLGADPWAELARAELRTTGERLPRRATVEFEQLTGQELEVALLVAAGATNREAAAALFLSPKTVEFHLAKIYRKLGVRSRTELSAVVVGGGHMSPAPSGVKAL